MHGFRAADFGCFCLQVYHRPLRDGQEFSIQFSTPTQSYKELEALSAVLGPLAAQVGARTDVEFPALGLPLLRCGKACEEFTQELMKCSLPSGGSR